MRDIIPDVRSAVRDVRNAGAALVILVVHSGLNEPSVYDTVSTGVASENVAARIAHEVSGIDVIVYGHTHKEMADTVIAGTLLMQPKHWATSVAVAQVRLERHNGRWGVTYKRSRTIQAVHHREDSQILAVAEEGHRIAVRYAMTRIGTSPVAWRADSARLTATPLTNFMLDAERQASGAQLASTAVYAPDGLEAGPITVAEMMALYPYDNTLRAVRISGTQLRAYIEHSARYFRANAGGIEPDPAVASYNYDVVGGVDYQIDVSRPIGARLTRLEFQGRPVADADTFTLALSNYRQSGGGAYAMFHSAPVVYDKGKDIRELLIDDVKRRGTLRPEDFAGTHWRVVGGAEAKR